MLLFGVDVATVFYLPANVPFCESKESIKF